MKRQEWRLAVRVLSGEATPQERLLWQERLASSPSLRAEFERVERTWQGLDWPVGQTLPPVSGGWIAPSALLRPRPVPSTGAGGLGLLRPVVATLVLGIGVLGGWGLAGGTPAAQTGPDFWEDESLAQVYLEQAAGATSVGELTSGESPP